MLESWILKLASKAVERLSNLHSSRALQVYPRSTCGGRFVGGARVEFSHSPSAIAYQLLHGRGMANFGIQRGFHNIESQFKNLQYLRFSLLGKRYIFARIVRTSCLEPSHTNGKVVIENALLCRCYGIMEAGVPHRDKANGMVPYL